MILISSHLFCGQKARYRMRLAVHICERKSLHKDNARLRNRTHYQLGFWLFTSEEINESRSKVLRKNTELSLALEAYKHRCNWGRLQHFLETIIANILTHFHVVNLIFLAFGARSKSFASPCSIFPFPTSSSTSKWEHAENLFSIDMCALGYIAGSDAEHHRQDI